MSKSAKKAADQAEREKVHKRYSNRREPDVIYPAKKQVDFYDADIHQRVAVYVRVSTDNLGQETSYELQKKTPTGLRSSARLRTMVMQSTVFLARRETDLVIIKSIFPALLSASIWFSSTRCFVEVPEIPLSA